MADTPLKMHDTFWLVKLQCPDCHSTLMPGPCGGAAQNYYCSNRKTCREGFNLTFVDGLLAFHERIGKVDNQRFRMYAARDRGQQ